MSLTQSYLAVAISYPVIYSEIKKKNPYTCVWVVCQSNLSSLPLYRKGKILPYILNEQIQDFHNN